MWNLWVVNGGEHKREWKKSVDLVESRVDAEDFERLVGSLLSQRAVYAYDTLLVGLGQGFDQQVPRYCHFRGFPSI